MVRLRRPSLASLMLALVASTGCGGKSGTKPVVVPDQPPPKILGSRIVFVSDRDGQPDIYLLNPADGVTTRVTRTSTAEDAPVISPDSTWIAYMAPVKGQYEIFVVGSDGSHERNVTNDPNGDDFKPRWSPDGARLMFTKILGATVSTANIYTIGKDGQDQRQVTHDGATLNLDWAPDGVTLLVLRGGDMRTIDLNGANLALIDTIFGGSAEYSPDGQTITFSAGTGDRADIYTISASGTGRVNLTNGILDLSVSSTWSPDGSRIAFMGQNAGANLDIYSMKPDGTDLINLTNNAAEDGVPNWGPR